MTNLERRALLGDRQAQEESTRSGIVLPCPFCGGKAIVKTSISTQGKSYAVRCENKCAVTCGHFRTPGTEWRTTTKKEALAQWNTRPAPPIGRCGECDLWYEEQGICTAASDDDFGIYEYTEPDHFCGYFKPKDGEEQ